MCTGAEVLTLAGTAAQAANQQQTQRDQQREVERRGEQARQLNERAGARVSQEVESLKDSTVDAGKLEQQKLQDDFMAALRRSQLSSGGSGLDSTPGDVSDQFSKDAAATRGANAAGNRAAAAGLARIDAPFMQRVRESAGSSRLRSDLSRVANEGQGQDFVSQLRMSLIQPNALVGAAGDFATGYGQAASKRAPATKKPSLFSQLPDQTPNYGVPS
jgi:hypothetical protein